LIRSPIKITKSIRECKYTPISAIKKFHASRTFAFILLTYKLQKS
jgi:hypothetical protein